MSPFRVLTVVLVVSALLLTVGSCRREPRGRCGRLIEELESPARAREAIRQLGERQGDRSCARAIPALAKMYEDGRYREDILRTLRHIGKEDATEHPEYRTILSSALENEVTGSLAANIIEQWELAELKDEVIALLELPDAHRARQAALRALLEITKDNREAIEDILMRLAVGDADRQGLRVNVMAVEELAKMRSTKAIPEIVKTMFLRTQRGEEMYQAARLALVKIGGEEVVEKLVATLEGENDSLRRFARDRGVPDWEWQDGPKIAQVLGDLSDQSAAKAVAENMAKRLLEPAGVTDKALDSWRISQSNRLTINMLTLARIGDDSVVEILAETIAGTDNDIKQRLDSATALAVIGTDNAIEALFKIYEESEDQRFRAPLLLPLSLALNSATLPRFDRIPVVEQRANAELVLHSLGHDPIINGSYVVVQECEGDDTECLIRNLNHEPEVDEESGEPEDGAAELSRARQWKAIIMLARKQDEVDTVIPALLEKFRSLPPDATDLRNYSLIALERVGRNDPRVYEGLEEILEEQRDKSGYDYWNLELEARIASFNARQADSAADDA